MIRKGFFTCDEVREISRFASPPSPIYGAFGHLSSDDPKLDGVTSLGISPRCLPLETDCVYSVEIAPAPHNCITSAEVIRS